MELRLSHSMFRTFQSDDLSQLVQVTDTTEKKRNLNRCGVRIDDVRMMSE